MASAVDILFNIVIKNLDTVSVKYVVRSAITAIVTAKTRVWFISTEFTTRPSSSLAFLFFLSVGSSVLPSSSGDANNVNT